MRKIPTSLATQHPDNADRYITVQQEPEEAFHSLSSQASGGLGIEEIMIDFEGKLTPYHQTSQITLGLIQKGLIPGKDIFVTPRIPNSKKEPIFRQLMSIMSLVETNILAYKEIKDIAICETIVPMIETGSEVIQIQDRINSVIELGNKNYDIQFPMHSIRVIPLIESVPALVNVENILEEFARDLINKGVELDYIRLMFARSDSAMSYGMVSSVLAVVIAIDHSLQWGKRNNVEVAPILGCGSLPFRGHLTLDTIDSMYTTYAGIKTYTIQSGLRYDHGDIKTMKVVNSLKENIHIDLKRHFAQVDVEQMKEYIGIFTQYYMTSFIKLINTVEKISQTIPKNRDRLASTKTGLEYIREIANMEEIAKLVKSDSLKKRLLDIDTNIHCTVPRAISFTAAMYTLGLPPEFIGVGRGLKELMNLYGYEGIEQLLLYYPQLKNDLIFASKYLNTRVSRGIVDESVRQEYIEDYEFACEILDIKKVENELNEDEFYHTLLKSTRPIILHLLGRQKDLFEDSKEEQKILNEWIVKMGKIRGSLG